MNQRTDIVMISFTGEKKKNNIGMDGYHLKSIIDIKTIQHLIPKINFFDSKLKFWFKLKYNIWYITCMLDSLNTMNLAW